HDQQSIRPWGQDKDKETMNHHLETVIRSPFWRPNIGHVVIVATILIGWGRMSERFDSVIQKQGEDEKQIEKMNAGGTEFSSNKLIAENTLLTDHTERIKAAETQIAAI